MNRRRAITRALWGAIAGVGLVVGPTAASGQLLFGVHGSRAADLFEGVDGVGVRTGLRVGPASLVAMGDWYFPECLGPAPTGACSYRSGAILGVLALPSPVVQPYVMAGVGRRWVEPDIDPTRSWGVAGVGLRAGLGGLGVFAELQAEGVRRNEARRWVFRLGLGS